MWRGGTGSLRQDENESSAPATAPELGGDDRRLAGGDPRSVGPEFYGTKVVDNNVRISVVIADAHPIYLDGLARALSSSATVVATETDGIAALNAIRQLTPQVALLDYQMPNMDGAQVAECVAREGINTRVVLISSQADSATVYRALQKGVSTYLTKQATAPEVVDAVLACSRGDYMIPAALTAGLVQEIRRRAVTEHPPLSDRETQILRLLAAGLSIPKISSELFLAPTTIKSHVQRIYEKLGVSNRGAVVAEAMRRGFLD